MHIEFYGGSDTVTGSQHILEANGHRILRDCGMYQGRRKDANRINRTIPFDVQDLHAVLLSHAHIDHSGNLPSLVKQGYQGPIFATTATCDLCQVMLRDAAKIQEQDALFLNKKNSRKGYAPIEPLYTMEDAEAALLLFQGHKYHDTLDLAPGIKMTSVEAGHILGSELSCFEMEEDGKTRRVGYAVDLGRHDLPLIRDPELLEDVDVLVMESTYGDRFHEDAALADQQLAEIILDTYQRGGKTLIPSFALERAQEILFHLSSLIGSGDLPEIPVFVDSPMATEVTRVFAKRHEYMDDAFMDLKEKMGHVLGASWIRFVSSVEDSKKLTRMESPCIVISASGMCEHGRILHHLKHGIQDPRNSIVIVGYQAQHTLGRRLVERQDEVRIFGETFERKANVQVLNAFSAHADRNDLINYAKLVRPNKVFLVHGEQKPREALAEALGKEGISDVVLPSSGDRFELT